ncbi:MAG: hypothetical protein QXI49_07240 [Candidatus Methanomethylicaceae archaeon]
MENSLKKLRNKGIRIVYTDNASYYHLACKWIRIEHRVYNINLKNIIERFIQIIKDRIECFDDYFPCLKEECNKEHIIKWIESFKIDYNYIRIHKKIGKPPLGIKLRKNIINKMKNMKDVIWYYLT